jgi:hypothetical protein
MIGSSDDGALHSVENDFDERNAFLYAMLGLVSGLRRAQAMLGIYGKGDGSGRDVDHPVLSAMLGIVSVSGHLFALRHLLDVPSEATRRSTPGPLHPPVGAGAPPRTLLE